MEIGEINRNGQQLMRRTDQRSTTHPFATIWIMLCVQCDVEYGCNSCDAHIRRCPIHEDGAAPAEPH